MADHKFRPEIEVLSAADVLRRRHWSDTDKIRLVEESFVGHRQVAATARRHGVSRSLLTIWRRQYREGELGAETPPAFIPLTMSPNPNRHLAGWQCILQADAYGGYNDLYRADRDPGPVGSALCWSHARRKFFELADIKGNARKGKPAHDIYRGRLSHRRSQYDANGICLFRQSIRKATGLRTGPDPACHEDYG